MDQYIDEIIQEIAAAEAARQIAIGQYIRELIGETRAVAFVDGNPGEAVIYSALNSADAVFGHRDVYNGLIEVLQPQRNESYQVFIRNVNENQENYDSGFLVDPLTGDREALPGYIQSVQPRYLNGRLASSFWQRRGLYRGDAGLIRGSDIRGADLTAGRLEALTYEVLQGAPGYVVGWFFEINRVPAPGDYSSERWLRMREGQRNCVVEAVRAAYGKNITATVERVLNEFEGTLDPAGASDEDIRRLSRALRCRIRVLDLAGNLVTPELVNQKTGQPLYAERRVITIYRHDGHASTHDPSVPEAKRVEVFEGSRGQPGESIGEVQTRMTEDAIKIIREKRPEQAQIIGGEVLSADGTLYRPKAIDRALHRAAADAGQRPRHAVDLNGQDGDELYKHDFDHDMPHDDILHVGGAQAYRFREWREKNGLLSAWKDTRALWRGSQLEAVVYRTADAREDAHEDAREDAQMQHIDMRAAYLGCDSLRGSGPAREWASKCGFPLGGKMRHARLEMVSSEALEGFAGVVEYENLRLTSKAPRGLAAQLAHHFSKGKLVLPIPLAIWLSERGIVESGPVTVHYCDRREALVFPENRDEAVRMVGSCSMRSARRCFYTRDAAEAAHYRAHYNAYSQPMQEGFLLHWEVEGGSANDFSHVRSYVLAYLAIAMGEAEASLGDAVLEKDTDAFVVRANVDVASLLGAQYVGEQGAPVAYGQLRPKEQKTMTRRIAIKAPPVLEWAGQPAAADLPVLARDDSALLIAEIGPGGSGKTHKWLHREYPAGEEPAILVQNNAAAADLRTIERNPHGYTVKTYHEFFRLGANSADSWTPAVMGTLALRTSRVIWDEFPVAGPVLLEKVLPWLRSKGVRVILAGDPVGQLQEIDDEQSGERVMELLRNIGADMRCDYGVDWRARDCPRLQEAKRRAWCADTHIQIGELRAVARNLTWREVVDEWRPDDIVLEPTRRLGAALSKNLAAIRREKYPDAPVRLRFAPVERTKYAKRGGVLPKVAHPAGGFLDAAVGTTIEIPFGTKYDPDLWAQDDTSTIHSIQGRTIHAPRRIYICADNLERDWCRNAPYVALSRAQRAEQLVVFVSAIAVVDEAKKRVS